MGPRQNQVKGSGRTPARRDEASLSELFPFLSKLPVVLRKVYVIPGLILLSLIVLAFRGHARYLIWLLAVVITAACFLFIYRISGKRKPWWVLLLACYSVFFFLGFPFAHSDPIGLTYRFSNHLKEGKVALGPYLLPGSSETPLYIPPGVQPQAIVNDLFDTKGNPLGSDTITGEMDKDQSLEEAFAYLGVQGVPILDRHDQPVFPAKMLLSILKKKEVQGFGPLLMTPLYDAIDTFERRVVIPSLGPVFLRSPRFLGFVSKFFEAGLPEEFIKSVPIFLLFFLGLGLSDPQRRRYGVTEPLDGIILGAATGAGFALAENLFHYIPQTTFSAGGQLALSSILLRSFDELSGHIAYAGFFGYFIGLAALRPKHRVRTLLIGYLIAATSHGLWDASGVLSLGKPLVLQLILASASYLLLAAAVVKAREISPSRAVLQPSLSFGFVRRLGAQAESFGSGNQLLKDNDTVPILVPQGGSAEIVPPPPVPPEPDPSVPGSAEYVDGRRYTVGRAKDCSLPIADDSVSRVHAEVWFLGPDRVRIRDLGSSNGTAILRAGREVALGEETVFPSDQIRFGEVTISAHDLIDALRGMAAASPREDARGQRHVAGQIVVARTNRGRMVRCACGAIKPIAQVCPMCGE